MTRQAFDVGIGTDAAGGIIEVDISCTGALRRFFFPDRGAHANSYNTYRFPMILAEARVLRDMLNDAIEHVEAGGHG